MNLIKRDAGVTLDDFAKDRIIHHALEARSVRLLYTTWIVGKITWYNSIFPDNSEDYIRMDDIDGNSIIFVED